MTGGTWPDYGLLDRAGIGSIVFYPRRDHTPPPDGAVDLDIAAEPGVNLSARLYAADRAFPTILYFHGNGEVVSDHDGIAPLYHAAGCNLFVVDYRGYGRSGGRPTFAALVADAHAAAARFHAELDARGFTGARFVMGRSLGSHPALELAAHRPERLRGLIIESGAANLRRLAQFAGANLPSVDVEALVEAHEAKIRSIRLPVLIIHGERDELIPVEHAAALYDLLENTERDLLIIPGAGHNDILWVGQRAYLAAIQRFVAQHGG